MNGLCTELEAFQVLLHFSPPLYPHHLHHHSEPCHLLIFTASWWIFWAIYAPKEAWIVSPKHKSNRLISLLTAPQSSHQNPLHPPTPIEHSVQAPEHADGLWTDPDFFFHQLTCRTIACYSPSSWDPSRLCPQCWLLWHLCFASTVASIWRVLSSPDIPQLPPCHSLLF